MEDVADDVDIEYGNEDEQEDDGPYGIHSGALSGPVLQPAAAAAAAAAATAGVADGGQRYGPASPGTSGGYSEDFPEDAELAEEASGGASAQDSGEALRPSVQPSGAEREEEGEQAEEPYTMDFGATAEISGSRAVLPAVSVPAGAAPEPVASQSGSVFSVEEDAPSGTVSSEPSATVLAPAVEAEESSPGAGQLQMRGSVDADEDADYTQDFTADALGATGALEAEQPVPTGVQLQPVLESHPISQPATPPAASDDEQEPEGSEGLEGAVEEEVEVGDEASDVGLDGPGADGKGAAEGPGEGEGLGGEAPEPEDSGAIVVPTGRGIRQTRQIESRVWRNQQAMFDDEEDGLEGEAPPALRRRRGCPVPFSACLASIGSLGLFCAG